MKAMKTREALEVAVEAAHAAGEILRSGGGKEKEARAKAHPRVLPLLRCGSGIRTTGSAALDLAYVAAGTLLVAGAGGKVSDLLGRPLASPQEGVLATNGLLHSAVLAAFGTSEEAA